MKKMISYQEALAFIEASAPSMGSEQVLLADSLGRVLAAAVFAEDNIPPFDNSAMDGFAVVAEDVQEAPSTLRIIEEIPAGTVPQIVVTPGNCSRIMTGALMPEGATAVVPVEWTAPAPDGSVTISRSVEHGRHIRLAGGDVSRKSLVADAGLILTPPLLGLLAAAGHKTINASQRPLVAVVATGDELVEPGQVLAQGKIRNSNGPALASQVTAAGAKVLGPLVARDSREAVEAILDDIAAADIYVFAGGVSVGDYDFVQESLERRGMETVFWRVRQRPGKPLLFGIINGKPVIGLPGNPVSASVCFEVYVRPLIERSMGVTSNGTRTALLRAGIEKKKDLHYFSRGIASIEDASLIVDLAGPQASNVFSTMARANCIVHLPDGKSSLNAGEKVSISIFPWSTL